ncbi:MAG TPA: hypothetical protein VIS04_03535 [Woeseiaceae bacterium]
MAKVASIVILALACGMAGTASADVLQMGETPYAAFEDSGKPGRGMTKDSVRSSFGSPEKQMDPVGDPPISRWEYAEFVVYFEYDRVIHAVRKR